MRAQAFALGQSSKVDFCTVRGNLLYSNALDLQRSVLGQLAHLHRTARGVGLRKYSPYTLFISAKSLMSARNTVVLTTLASVISCCARMAWMFLRDYAVSEVAAQLGSSEATITAT